MVITTAYKFWLNIPLYAPHEALCLLFSNPSEASAYYWAYETLVHEYNCEPHCTCCNKSQPRFLLTWSMGFWKWMFSQVVWLEAANQACSFMYPLTHQLPKFGFVLRDMFRRNPPGCIYELSLCSCIFGCLFRNRNACPCADILALCQLQILMIRTYKWETNSPVAV